MYFCYVDESGDSGRHDPNDPEHTGSAYFILSGLIVRDTHWKTTLDSLKSFRKHLAQQAYLRYDVEFHCADLIDVHKVKEYSQISVPDRWKLIDRFAEVIGSLAQCRLISVVINKVQSVLNPEDYATTAITKLYQAFDEFLKTQDDQHGVVFFDRANEQMINAHVRKLLRTGASGQTIPNVTIGWIIEDPIFRVSHESMFIQAADVCTYTLKECLFPQSSRKKFNADKIYNRRLLPIVYVSSYAQHDDGIIWT